MPFTALSQYPPGHRRPLHFVLGLSALTALEGLGALLWLALQPSEAGSRLFLHYSPQRWALLLSTFLLLLAVLSVFWVIQRKPAWAASQVDTFSQPHHANWLLAAVSGLLLLGGGALAWLSQQAALAKYFTRLLPLLAWILLALAQSWIVLAVAMRRSLAQMWSRFFPVEKEKRVFPVESGTFLRPILLAITLLYLTVQVRACIQVAEANLFADSEDYLYGAGLPLNNPAFFSERRPWGILLIYKLLGRSLVAIDLFQVALSAAAWLGLVWTVVHSLQNRWAKILGYCAILGFSLTPTVQVWNHAVLSESLSISGMVILLALFLRLAQQWEWRTFFFLALGFIVWMSVREAHTYLGLLVAGILLPVGFARRTSRVYWLLMVCILAAFFVNNRLASAYRLPRWALPMAEVITMRILSQPEYLDFFARHGMPTSPRTAGLERQMGHQQRLCHHQRSQVAKIFQVAVSRFAGCVRPLLAGASRLSHPVALAKHRAITGGRLLYGPPHRTLHPRLARVRQRTAVPHPLVLAVLLGLPGCGWFHLRRKPPPAEGKIRSALPVLPALHPTSVPDLARRRAGVERHAVLANIQWRLGLALIVILYLDSLVRPRHSQA